MTPDQVYGAIESVAFWLFVLVIVTTVFFGLLAEEPVVERIFAFPIVAALIFGVAYGIYEPAAGVARFVFKEPFTETGLLGPCLAFCHYAADARIVQPIVASDFLKCVVRTCVHLGNRLIPTRRSLVKDRQC